MYINSEVSHLLVGKYNSYKWYEVVDMGHKVHNPNRKYEHMHMWGYGAQFRNNEQSYTSVVL